MQWEQRPGETIYKGHRSYDLMLNLQLGIRWSISRNARDPALRQLPNSVFSEKVIACKSHTEVLPPQVFSLLSVGIPSGHHIILQAVQMLPATLLAHGEDLVVPGNNDV